MEEILDTIIKAEQEAEQIKNSARLRAAEIIEKAEKRAAEIEKKSVEECKLLKEKKIAEAQKKAQADYESELAEKSAQAKEYADGVLKKCAAVADKIVGGIVRGDS